MSWRRTALLLACLAAVAPHGIAQAQDPDVEAPPATTTVAGPLEDFVRQVARFWSTGDVGSIVGLLPADNRLMLDTGSGIETANSRHAAAALRSIFAESETTGASAVRVTVASAQPTRGFGEIAWTFRARGAPGEQLRSVYVGARWEEADWKITELRIMP